MKRGNAEKRSAGLTSVFWFYLDATAIGSRLGAAAAENSTDHQKAGTEQ